MALKTLDTRIGERRIFAKQWSASKAVKNKIWFLNDCKQFILPFMQGEYTFEDVLALTANVEEKKLLPVIKEVLFQVNVEGENFEAQSISEGNFDLLFTGRLIDIYKIFGQVLKLQYADFFEQSSELLQ